MTVTSPIVNFSNSSSMIFSILVGICLSFIALITAIGNIIVLLAFYCDNKLRTINDYFILNMAIADFLVGFFCIPFYIPFSLTQSWPFGRLFCKIWVTIDDVATMASVINIVAITINRYWSIAYPISYRKYIRQNLVYIVMAFIWCLSFVNFAPGIWLLSLFNKETFLNNQTSNDCSGDYNKSFIYMLIAQFNYFIWPFILLCLLNLLIILNIWKRTRKINRLMSFNINFKSKDETVYSSCVITSKDAEDDQNLSTLSKKNKFPIEQDNCPSIIIERTRKYSLNQNFQNKTKCLSFNQKKASNKYFIQLSFILMLIINFVYLQRKSSKKNENELIRSATMLYLYPKSSNQNRKLSNNDFDQSHVDIETENENECERSKYILNETNRLAIKSQQYRQTRSRINRDRKAARSLFILVIVFLIFLFPYVICATVSTAGFHVSTIIFEISFWLLWMNSTCNPFLYPFIQIKYRRAYIKLFRSFSLFFHFSRSDSSI